MLKIFPVLLMLAGAAVFAGGFAVSAHVVDDSNAVAMLSHCDNAAAATDNGGDKNPPAQKTEGGLFGALKNFGKESIKGVESRVEKLIAREGKKYACAAAEKDLAELKTEMRALFAQINGYVRLLGRGVTLFGVVLVLIGASNFAAVGGKT